MKTLLHKVLLACFAFITFFNVVNAQEVLYTSSNTYYWNPFEPSSNLGVFNNSQTGTSTVTVSNSSPLNGSYSLKSVNNNVTSPANGGVWGSIVPVGTDVATNNFEWTFLYKFTGATANIVSYLPSVAKNNAGWRYWVVSNSKTPGATGVGNMGIFFTQIGSQLQCYSKESSDQYRNLNLNYTLTAGTTYSIKLKRIASGGTYVIYVDPVTASVPEAITNRLQINFAGGLGTYSYSVLESNDGRTAANGTFQWDDFKMFQPFESIADVPFTPTSTTLYPGTTGVLAAEYSVTLRDVINIKNSYIYNTIGPMSSYISAARLYVSTTNSLTGATLLSPSSAITDYNFINNSSTADNIANSDQAGDTYYYFVVLDMASSYPSGGVTSFNLSNPNVAYDNNNGYIYNLPLTANAPTFTLAVPSAPTVTTTTPVTNIYGGTGTVGGSITATGGSTVTDYGIAYSSTVTTPSISDGKFLIGSGATGATTYSAPLQGLSPNTTYYIRAYATNSTGTSYGAVVTFKTLAPPDLSYSPSTQTYTVNTNVGSIAIANNGGAVPANTYLATSTFKSGLSNYFITFDAAGNLYESDYNSIIKITPAGVQTTIASGFYTGGSQTGIAVDAAGNIYVGTTANIIYKVTPAGVTSTFISTGTLNQPYGMVFDNAGNLYIASYAGNTIQKVAAGTTSLSTYATGFNGPYAIEIDATGKIFEADRTGSKIYSVVGGVKTQVTGTFTSPTGIAVAADGSIYFSSISLSNNIFVVPPGSSTATSILASGLNTPRGVILDNTGNFLYISNSSDIGTGTIVKQSVTGYTYTGTLPTGLSFDYTTGTVTGTATAVTAPTGNTITVTGYNSAGNDVTTLTIIINPVAPTVTGTITLCGAQTTTLTAAGGLPAGGTYNWYSAATGGTAIATGTTYTPFVGGTTTLYVSYTSGVGVSARTPVTVTVNQRVSSSINSPMISYPFESGALTDWSVLGNDAIISTAATTIAPTLTADRNGMANSAYQFAGTNATPSYIYSSVNYSQMPLVFSYSLWFKTTVGGGRLLGFSGQQNGNGASLANATHDRDLYMTDDGRLGFSIYTALASHTQSIVTTAKYLDGLWHHVIVTLGNSNGMRLYVDGVWANSTTPYNTYVAPQTGSGYWRIGGDATSGTASPTNNYFTGAIDDVAVYNYEMSATDALSNDMNLYKFTAGYCANNPITVMAQTIATATYAWVDNDNNAITSAVNPTLFANATSTFYKLTTTVNGCSNIANVTPNNLTFTWTGAASTDFTGPLVTTNWTNSSTNSLNQNPSFNGTESIVIPGTGITNYPVLGTGTFKIFSLTMASGATLNLNGKTLTIGCNILNSNGGQILYSGNNASKITWGGALASQNYYGSATANSGQTADMEINNTVAGTVTFRTGVFDAYDLLKLTSGNLAIASPVTFTLKSLSTLTASIDVIPSSYSITGNINAERYVTGGVLARRAYRLMSAPVNQGVITGTSLNGYGFTDLQKTTPITGYSAMGTAYSSATVPSNAFDQSLLGNPTVFFYNEADIDPINQQFINSDYKGIATIGEKLPVGNGFLFFFRGDRTVNSAVNGVNKTSTGSIPENTTLRWTGVPNQGAISVSIPATSSVISDGSGHKVYKTPSSSGGFSTSLGFTNVASSLNNGLHLIGNPYASAIDLDLITVGNASTNKFVYMLNNSNTFGVYTRGSGSATLNNGVGRYVASGQGFFVFGTSAGNTTVSFTEAAKINTIPVATTPTTFMTTNKPTLLAMGKQGSLDLALSPLSITNAAPVQTAAPAVVNITLLRDSDNMNETVIQFGDKSTPGSNKYNQAEDAVYRSGISQTTFLASYTTDSKPCIINTMGALDTIKSVPLYVEGNVDALYKLSFKGAKTIDSRYVLYLVDHFMKDSLDLSANDTYNFTIQRGNAQTFGATRFELVKHKSGLQYNLLGFNGVKKTGSVVLNWKTEHEGTYTMFALQRSIDGGKTFTTIDSVASDGSGNYTMTDIKPASGTNQYRLVQTVGLDPSALSKVVIIGYQPAGNDNLIANFDLFPNPSVDIIKLRLKNITQGKLSIKIYNVDGRVVSNSKADAGGTISQDVSRLLHGGYVLEVSNADGSYYATKKFSKL